MFQKAASVRSLLSITVASFFLEHDDDDRCVFFNPNSFRIPIIFLVLFCLLYILMNVVAFVGILILYSYTFVCVYFIRLMCLDFIFVLNYDVYE